MQIETIKALLATWLYLIFGYLLITVYVYFDFSGGNIKRSKSGHTFIRKMDGGDSGPVAKKTKIDANTVVITDAKELENVSNIMIYALFEFCVLFF